MHRCLRVSSRGRIEMIDSGRRTHLWCVLLVAMLPAPLASPPSASGGHPSSSSLFSVQPTPWTINAVFRVESVTWALRSVRGGEDSSLFDVDFDDTPQPISAGMRFSFPFSCLAPKNLGAPWFASAHVFNNWRLLRREKRSTTTAQRTKQAAGACRYYTCCPLVLAVPLIRTKRYKLCVHLVCTHVEEHVDSLFLSVNRFWVLAHVFSYCFSHTALTPGISKREVSIEDSVAPGTWMHKYKYINTFINIYMCICTYIFTYIYIYVYMYIHINL